ncbi:MAG: glycine zipper 2TM domain-containing protein, partial [Gammaproteobacteria bacterium]|nr:glycine zipper 2TM domain-containing protein [Gammaproteobacteria bacterium]
MKKLAMAGVAAMAVALAGCQEVRNEQVGTVVGGGLGGLLGAQVGGGKGQIAAAVAGALVGAYLGGQVGKSMDEVDRMKANRALESTPTGQTSSWSNPDTGHQYTVTPTRTYQTDSGAPCRDYTTEAIIDGRKEYVKGTA